MLHILLSLMAIGLVLLADEYLWRHKVIRGEAARKFAHILIGSFIATWPIYMSWQEVRIALAIGIVGALVVRQFRFFPSIFDIKRSSLGDLAAPVFIIIAAFVEPTKTIFAVTVLHISFADGMAAMIGSQFGHKRAYNIRKQKKSLAGTAAFYASSMIIMTTAAIFRSSIDPFTIAVYIGFIPVVATFAENVSPNGSDNFFVPLAVLIPLLLVS
jgi:dolichol kinase